MAFEVDDLLSLALVASLLSLSRLLSFFCFCPNARMVELQDLKVHLRKCRVADCCMIDGCVEDLWVHGTNGLPQRVRIDGLLLLPYGLHVRKSCRYDRSRRCSCDGANVIGSFFSNGSHSINLIVLALESPGAIMSETLMMCKGY